MAHLLQHHQFQRQRIQAGRCSGHSQHKLLHAPVLLGRRQVQQEAAKQVSVAQTTLFRNIENGVEVEEALQQHLATPSGTTDLIVMYTATWCGPCAIVHKELQKLAALRPCNKHPGRPSFQVLVVDVERPGVKAHCSELGISALPTLCFVGRDVGRPVVCTVGHTNHKVIQDILDNRMHISGADLKVRLKIN